MKYSDDALRKLYAKGLSFDQIAIELEVTRNAVAGKVKRLKLVRKSVRPNKHTIAIKPHKYVEMTREEMREDLRKAVENTK